MGCDRCIETKSGLSQIPPAFLILAQTVAPPAVSLPQEAVECRRGRQCGFDIAVDGCRAGVEGTGGHAGMTAAKGGFQAPTIHTVSPELLLAGNVCGVFLAVNLRDFPLRTSARTSFF